jgi:hypothetical protein
MLVLATQYLVIKTKKNTQTPTGIMISTKKQFHPLDENPRHSNLSLSRKSFRELFD